LHYFGNDTKYTVDTQLRYYKTLTEVGRSRIKYCCQSETTNSINYYCWQIELEENMTILSLVISCVYFLINTVIACG